MSSERKIYSVTEVNRKARMVLEGALGELWVEGELSRVTIHSSGHWYFTLKDEGAAVSCAMFSRDNAGVGFRPKDGMKVQMLARPSLYEANGRYQLIASEMEEAGKGSLQEQFEKLKAKLAAEGLFDESRKKPLPLLPRKIGVVTSPTGAAIRDIINVLTRRFPNLEILLAPVTVQGSTAAKSIAAAIRYLNKVGQASSLSTEDMRYFFPFLPVEIDGRHLPHWKQEGTTYFITFRLADSLPKKKLRQWREERDQWLRIHEDPYSLEEQEEYAKLFSEKINQWLDAGSGSCILEEEANAKMVENALLHFEGDRYRLGSYVIMANHVHVLVSPMPDSELSDILHSWKSFTANELNKSTEGKGAVWQDESYDHIVRSPEQLVFYTNYIRKNIEQSGGKALARVDRLEACPTLPIDLMIVGRGGGSIEDLWAFNEEVVARAIFDSEIPVISAVGHEIDFTISDFAADVRAPTPSAAAELAVREKSTFEDELSLCRRRLKQSLKTMEQDFRLRLSRAAHSYVFKEPAALVARHRVLVASMKARLPKLLLHSAANRHQRMDRAETKMAYSLRSGVQQAHQHVDELGIVMQHRAERKIESDRQKLQQLESQLRMLNPLEVLGRGYSLTRKTDGTLVRSTESVKEGEVMITQLADGKVVSNITEKE